MCPMSPTPRACLVAAGSRLAGIVWFFSTTPEPIQGLRAFYFQARPPGHWMPLACKVGEADRESIDHWRQGLVARELAADSIFCSLVGIGSWPVGSPPPT